MEAKKEAEEEETSKTVMKLPLLPSHSHNNHSISSPIHSSIAASVPFSWEQEPGKPKHSPPSSTFSAPLPSHSPSSSETNKSLELPPRLNGGGIINLQSPNTVFDGPYSMARSRRLESPSFKMIVKGNGGGDFYGSFRSENYGDLEDVEEECKQTNISGGHSLVLVKKAGRLGLFGFRRRKALKGKTEFGRGSYVFPSSVDRECECSKKDEAEEKRLDFGDGISSSQSSRFSEVKITKISRTGSFSDLPASSSTKSRFWTNVYAGMKKVVPWKNKKTTG